jgi:trans-aconitate methyltransferase
MYIADVNELIRIDHIAGAHAQTWSDLGCGTGAFTLALATLLPPGSVIHAIDKDDRSLSQFPDRHQDVTIRKEVVDLGKSDLSLPALDGVLVANFLRFIKHKGLSSHGYGPCQSDCWLLNTMADHRVHGYYNRLASLPCEPCSWNEDLVKSPDLETRASRFGGELYSALAEW